MKRLACFSVVFLSACLGAARAADYFADAAPGSLADRHPTQISGKIVVVDGRTLWFADRRVLVRLAGIDSCELPQWSFAPKPNASPSDPIAPVACGALAKAWLKRLTGTTTVSCNLRSIGAVGETEGFCRVHERDLGLQMLRVGLARVGDPSRALPGYIETQESAIASRYGIWATYVLDMNEWRRRAVDKTLGRRPQADINLLATRESEVSPPFADARRQPARRDR